MKEITTSLLIFKITNFHENQNNSSSRIPDLVHWIWNAHLGFSENTVLILTNPLQNM